MTTLLSCEQCQPLLPVSVSGHLDADERDAVELHLAGCAACRNDFSLWRALPDALDALEGDSLASPSVHDAWRALEARLPASASFARDPAPQEGTESSLEYAPGVTYVPATSEGKHYLGRPPRLRDVSSVLLALLLVAVSSGLFYYLRQGRSPTPTNPGNNIAPVVLSYHPTHVLTSREMLPKTVFYDVQMLSPDDGWAVGGTEVFANNAVTYNSAIYHYQRGRWIASPDVVPGGLLFSVSMVSPNDGWAVGGISTGGAARVTEVGLMLHYDGHHWSSFPIPAHIQLNKVKILSATEGWAMANDGTTYPFLHYLRGVWSDVTSSPPVLYMGLALNSANEGWAAGYGGAIAHYADGRWTPWPTSAPGDVTDVAMRSSSDGWMIAETPENHTGKLYQQVIALHFDGKEWTPEPLASSTLTLLVTGITLSSTGGWLAGRIEDADGSVQGSVLFQYAGGRWKLEPFQVDAALVGISFSSSSEGWAVGFKNSIGSFPNGSSGTTLSGVILHYFDGQWSVYQP